MTQLNSETVNAYMQALSHPLKDEIEALRKVIKSADSSIQERIKWNAPSYYTSKDFLTFNHRLQDKVHLIFHHPAIVDIRSSLLEGDYKDRRMVYFKSKEDIAEHQDEFTRIIRNLIAAIDKS